MLTVAPGFASDMPLWPHTNVAAFHDYFEQTFDEPALSTVLQAAAAHEVELAAMGGVTFGMLWVPDATTGVVLGTGFVGVHEFPEPTDIDTILAGQDRYKRAFGEKVHELTVGRIDDVSLGPAGMRYLSTTKRGRSEIECRMDIWAVLNEQVAVQFTMAYLDPAHDPLVTDALGAVIAHTDVVDEP